VKLAAELFLDLDPLDSTLFDRFLTVVVCDNSPWAAFLSSWLLCEPAGLGAVV
jgi:hypothetical protein